ncbi:alpha/beta hydrolase [Bradyrhizobium liaoningense]|uniref:alpha/beta hydrolase n=1 Tax=Bradyrhizobium liaoningense TaxID=43992 RepID=UPI001BA92C90|nr:alpha/beta hydrolase [Bradyrhizobium liaoningense]MBR0839871.1 alpha/beta hydrolase [Bradyrhizobium liaoningense]
MTSTALPAHESIFVGVRDPFHTSAVQRRAPCRVGRLRSCSGRRRSLMKMSHVIASLPFLILFAFQPAAATGPDQTALAQSISTFIEGVRTSDLAKVKSTTVQGYRAGDQPKYAILSRLGQVTDVDLGDERRFSQQTIVEAEVRHANGASSWTFSIQAGSRIVAAEMTSASVYGARAAATSAKTTTGGPARYHHRRYSGGYRRPVVLSCESSPSSCNQDARLVEFFYATDRNIKITNNVSTLDTNAPRSGILTYGVAGVRIPEDHEPGKIELPSEWHFLSFDYKAATDETKHFSIKRLAATSYEDWKDLVKRQADQSENRALIFVHGFNTGFEDALYRNAQIVWDLQYQGVSVLFSWSSKGKVRDYGYDQDSADIAQAEFVELLTRLHESGIEHIDIIAHSMGNRVVLPALDQLATGSSPVRVRQLVMAAPDVARDKFMIQLPLAQKIVAGSTLYASSADKALIASAELADFPRAGMVSANGPVLLPNLDTIDVTAIGDEILGLNHTVFATNRAVMDDLKLLLINGMKLPRLAQVRKFPEPPQPSTYWKYK